MAIQHFKKTVGPGLFLYAKTDLAYLFPHTKTDLVRLSLFGEVGNERILYYWARIYIRNLKTGNDYINLKKTIEVLIVNFEIKELKELEYHSKWKIIEEKDRKLILTEDLELHIIEIPKIYRTEGKEELEKWIYFIEIEMIQKITNLMKEEIEAL